MPEKMSLGFAEHAGDNTLRSNTTDAGIQSASRIIQMTGRDEPAAAILTRCTSYVAKTFSKCNDLKYEPTYGEFCYFGRTGVAMAFGTTRPVS